MLQLLTKEPKLIFGDYRGDSVSLCQQNYGLVLLSQVCYDILSGSGTFEHDVSGTLLLNMQCRYFSFFLYILQMYVCKHVCMYVCVYVYLCMKLQLLSYKN